MMNEGQREEWNSWIKPATEDGGTSRCFLRSDPLLAADAEMKALRQQRDELLTALKQIVLWYECDLALTAEPIKQAKAAIAMAEGGAA